MSFPIKIITCPQWHAKPPKSPPVLVVPQLEIIFHHTDSHHREISNPKDESLEEAIRFVLDIQDFHMRPVSQGGRGWNDSGHNLLITRAGHILQGRWYTVTAIQHGHMVESAHCPEHNRAVGIEHEHLPGEHATEAQLEASARAIAWVSWCWHRKIILPIHPHQQFYNTACPGNLLGTIPTVGRMATKFLKGV